MLAAAVELDEVGAQAGAGRVRGRIGDRDVHLGRGEQALHGAHRRHELGPADRVDAVEHRGGQGIAALVQQRSLRAAARGQPRHADAAVDRAGIERDEPVGLQQAQQPAELAGVEAQARAQRAHLAALVADLPPHAGCAQRPVAGQVAIVQRPTRWVTVRLKRRTSAISDLGQMVRLP